LKSPKFSDKCEKYGASSEDESDGDDDIFNPYGPSRNDPSYDSDLERCIRKGRRIMNAERAWRMDWGGRCEI
jgi:hypothetical protein